MDPNGDGGRDVYIIADDAVPILRLMQWKLRVAFGKDTDIRLAEDGDVAVEVFLQLQQEGRQEDIVAILMDYHMPKRSGLEAITAIRNLERVYRVEYPVGIIAFSADISDEMTDLMLSGGANYMLPKPPDPGDLEKLCRELRELKRLRTQTS
jgi:CheY-like chemotaxis protein